ncbi:hypothetical protein [Roseovarius nanhaiticus]|uniref:hypothetical protein n=1 Tax=Roseovarius nanhaiticus TaxID=573024 RepID=UPI002490791B|nr:hypothetical protein [Roseovarius nanhaiticus]
MTHRKEGRPASYTNEQLMDAIETIEGRGAETTTAAVKKQLVTEYGVSGGINDDSLKKAITGAIEDRSCKKLSRLLLALPEDAKASAGRIGERVAADILEHMAFGYHGLRTSAEKALIEKDEDLRNSRSHIRTMEDRVEEMQVERAALEHNNLDLREKNEALQAQLRERDAKIRELAHSQEYREEMMAFMKQIVKDNDAKCETQS